MNKMKDSIDNRTDFFSLRLIPKRLPPKVQAVYVENVC